jgi:hypothetical protein
MTQRVAHRTSDQIRELQERLDQVKGEVVFGFYEDLIPSFHQGYTGINELCSPVTAEEVTGYVAKIHELQNKMSVTIGVGDGSGELFVHGDYDSVKRVQSIIFENERLRRGERFFLAQDDSCHWYLVPDTKRAEWEAWRNLSGADERSWTVPDFAKPIDGPHRLTFTNPE